MPPTPDQMDKAALRRQLREHRKAIGASQRHAASRALVGLALRHHLLAKGRRIGVYMPTNNEIDVRPLLDRALTMQAHCFLPIVPRRERKRMWFSQMGKRPAWVLNRYGIPEYRHPLAKRVRVQRLDLLFMPLLGFDWHGFRLGMGGGYYDASLAYLKRFRRWRRPWIVGVAFAVQEVEGIPNDPWDIPLDAVLTEQEYRVFRSNRY
jgi:5-formyltetrahydrofolate cyclo-ligase